MKASDLKPASYNPRKALTKKAAKGLSRSLKEFGDISGITWNKRTGNIVGGHKRVEILTAAGASFDADSCSFVLDGERFKVREVDWDENKERAANVAANSAKIAGEFDDSLPDFLADLKLKVDGDLFDDLRLGELCSLPGEEIEEDEIPEAPSEPVTKEGDVWLLGDHTLVCGDMREQGGGPFEMCFTDPPYGVNYEGGHFHSGDVNVVRKRENLANDATDIYTEAIPKIAELVKGPCYTFFADSKALPVYSAISRVGEIHALIIWHKINAKYAAMNAQYKQRHEPCLYWKPRGSTLRWQGASTESTIWELKRDAQNKHHPTQKPVELAAKAIANHNAGAIFDPFAGSGSTLIACEQLGRRCHAVEIEPKYCDVIVERWENLTGGKAKRQTG